MLPGMSEKLARATRSTATSQAANSLPMRPMAIKITTETHRDRERNGTNSKHSGLSADPCAPVLEHDDSDADMSLKTSIV